MHGCSSQSQILSRGKIPPLPSLTKSSPYTNAYYSSVRFKEIARFTSLHYTIKAQSSNVGAGSYEGGEGNDSHKLFVEHPTGEQISEPAKRFPRVPFPVSLAGIILGCGLAFCLVAFLMGGPSLLLAAIAKSGFAAAFTLIFVSEIGDKTFFITALLAMQYGKGLVLMGSMGALSLMTILSVVIGRMFQSVPLQFRTSVPIGEYAAVALLMFFGFKPINDAWKLPSRVVKSNEESSELGELVEAEELVKEKVAKRLTNPLEIMWKSFSLVFFTEWGDRSMLATIALGAAQSPWGVASGAIAGHLVATSVAVLGGGIFGWSSFSPFGSGHSFRSFLKTIGISLIIITSYRISERSSEVTTSQALLFSVMLLGLSFLLVR